MLEFKAGRLNKNGNLVTADPAKGLVTITTADDGLLHFYWKDRTSLEIKQDLILFPEEARWKRVEQCKDGNVYVLVFNSSDKRLFYWMQEPDDGLANKVNNAIQAFQEEEPLNKGLNALLSLDNVLPLLDDETLLQHLPKNAPKTKDELKETITSPQFQEAVRLLSNALESEQGPMLMQQLGVNPKMGGVYGFLAALVEKFKKSAE